MIRRAALALAMVAAAAAPALAQPGAESLDEPDPIKPDRRAVEEASEANLEPESRRQGLAIGVAAGPNMQVGFGIEQSTGTGGSFAVRFGTVASPRWVWLLELATTAYQQKLPGSTDTRTNQSALFTLGGQLYVKEAFWLRGGGGAAHFTRHLSGETTDSFWGVGVIGAGGLDVLRRRSFAVSLEALGAVARYRAGYVAGGTLQLGFSWY